MGSLPNLHELSAGSVDVVEKNDFRTRNVREKGSTIDWRRTNHRPLYHTNSLGSNPNSCVVNPSLLKRLSYDKSSFSSGQRRSRSIQSSSLTYAHSQNAGTSNLIKHISRQASISSSTGASSVRKLIAVVRSTPSHFGPTYSRKIIRQNFVGLCLSYGMFTVAFIPIVILQGSISTWADSSLSGFLEPGAILLAGLYHSGAWSALSAPFVVHKIGVTKCLTLCYATAVVFLSAHLYPNLGLLGPAYGLMGWSIGYLNICNVTYLMMLATKLKFVLNEEEENELQCSLESAKRESLAQKLFRGISIAQNLGLITGGAIAYFLIYLTSTSRKNERDSLVDRICGYESCPRGIFSTNKSINTSPAKSNMVLSCETNTLLAGVFLGFCIVGTIVAILFVHRIRICFNHRSADNMKTEDRKKTMRKTIKTPVLRFISPLLIFIGIEQGFMFADFTKFYVTCVMGIQNTPLIFISLGILQSVAGSTLGFLVHHIPRYFIMGVGFVFQACLLLVLILWKPTSDDSALFYVISAAWGVCNAIWDTITFGLFVSSFPNCWEFPFSFNFFFRFMGLSFAFLIHNIFCTYVKLYIMGFMLIVAVFSYAWLEIRLYLKSVSKDNR